MIYLSFVKLNFLSTYNYVQFNHINLDIKVLPFLQHLAYDFQIGSAMRFFKNVLISWNLWNRKLKIQF